MTQETGHMTHNTGYRIQDTGYRIHDTGYAVTIEASRAWAWPIKQRNTGIDCHIVHPFLEVFGYVEYIILLCPSVTG